MALIFASEKTSAASVNVTQTRSQSEFPWRSDHWRIQRRGFLISSHQEMRSSRQGSLQSFTKWKPERLSLRFSHTLACTGVFQFPKVTDALFASSFSTMRTANSLVSSD